MYAVIEVLGKQYRAEIGRELVVDFFSEEESGKTLEFPALFFFKEGQCQIGVPYVEGVKVQAQVGESFRDKKILIFKYNRRKGYRKTRGHRQSRTKVLITGIVD